MPNGFLVAGQNYKFYMSSAMPVAPCVQQLLGLPSVIHTLYKGTLTPWGYCFQMPEECQLHRVN